MGDEHARFAELAVQRAALDGAEIAFLREGRGYPVLLLHGWPETKRIWARNILPLAQAGFEVIAPDLRGFGESGLAEDGFYDLAAHSRDMYQLVHDVLGHEKCALVGGDLGGAVMLDLGARYEGFVEQQLLFNSALPLLRERYEAAGIELPPPHAQRPAYDYFARQAREPEALLAELDTAHKRHRYIAEFYGHRFWASPGAFSAEDVEFMTEPFLEPERLLAGWKNYGTAVGALPSSSPPLIFQRSAVPTLALYGPEDHVIWPAFPRMCEVAFTELIGPFSVERAGHFMQWERAGLINQSVIYLLGGRL